MADHIRPRIGVVGLDQVGRRYTDIIRSLDYSIVGVDADKKARLEFEKEYGVETYRDPKAMDEMGLDAVVVSTPNSYHEVVAVSALESGIHTFIEKPLAHSEASAERIVDAANESAGICMVGYYLAYFELVESLQSYVEDGYFGDITHIEGRYQYRRGVPRRGSWYTSKEFAGGGVLQDKGSFILDLLTHFGFSLDRIDSVMAKARTEFGHDDAYTAGGGWGSEGQEGIFDVEDSITALLEFEDGKTATVETAWALNGPKEHTYQIRGTDAGAYLDMHTGDLTLYRMDGSRTMVDKAVQPPLAEEVIDDTEGYGFRVNHHALRKRIFREFWRCIEEGDEPERGSPEQALTIQRAIADIYAAAGDPMVD